jgi:hypothetical protein
VEEVTRGWRKLQSEKMGRPRNTNRCDENECEVLTLKPDAKKATGKTGEVILTTNLKDTGCEGAE